MTYQDGWYPDPLGRHEQRYYRGGGWTEHVTDAGTPAVDPIESVAPAITGKTRSVTITHAKYLGGWPDQPKESPGNLVVDSEGVHHRVIRDRFVIPWARVTAITVEGPEEASRRVTASRVVAMGVFALAAKKKTKTAYVTIGTDAGDVFFEVDKLLERELRAKVGPAIPAEHRGKLS